MLRYVLNLVLFFLLFVIQVRRLRHSSTNLPRPPVKVKAKNRKQPKRAAMSWGYEAKNGK